MVEEKFIELLTRGARGFKGYLFKAPFPIFSTNPLPKVEMVKVCIIALISALWIGSAYAQQGSGYRNKRRGK